MGTIGRSDPFISVLNLKNFFGKREERKRGIFENFLGPGVNQFINSLSLELANSKDREFMNWLTPGPRKFSKIPLFLSSLFPKKFFKFKTLMNGSDRPIVPIGVYEEVLPLNVLPAMLLRNIVLLDTEKIQSLGGLELDEEDLSLCSYVCPGKYDFGSLLRAGLTKIEVEG